MKTKVMTKKIVSKTNVERTKGNGRSYPYLYPIGDLAQGGFQKGFHVCIDQKNFLRSFLTNTELKVN
jgi:hypothetical protein